MSVNQSVIDQLTVMEKACAEIRKTLGLAELSAPSAPSAPSASAKKPRAKKDPKPEPSGEKKAPSDWDVLLANTIEEMKTSGWPEWTDAAGVLWHASRLDTVTDKKGNSTETYVFDGGDHDGKPPSRALGGMKRASFLKAQTDPVAAEKAKAYLAKLAEKRAASSTGSAEKKEPVADEKVEAVAEEKPKKQSEETKQKRAATIAAKKAAEAAAAAAAVAAAAAPEDEIEDIESEPEAADAEPEPVKVAPKPTPKPTPVAAAAPKKIVKTAPKATKKPVSLVMEMWVHDGETYRRNERGDVADMDGDFFGHWDGKEIDQSASQPADWGNAELFFPPSE
jgi:hypothetical protein